MTQPVQMHQNQFRRKTVVKYQVRDARDRLVSTYGYNGTGNECSNGVSMAIRASAPGSTAFGILLPDVSYVDEAR